MGTGEREELYAAPASVAEFLSAGARRHLLIDHWQPQDKLRTWVPDVVELVATGGVPESSGYAVLHLSVASASPEIQSLSDLAALARPRRKEAKAFLAASFPSADETLLTQIATRPRAFSITLAKWPDPNSAGLIRWEGSSALERRLATLVTLPRDGRVLESPYPQSMERPTPSHVAAWSASSVAIVRCRALRLHHIDELRTLWLDAVMLELHRHAEVTRYARQATKLARRAERQAQSRDWRQLDRDFRVWRARMGMNTDLDHPMEQALAVGTRAALGTDHVSRRVQVDLEAHSTAEASYSSDQLGRAVAILAVATAVIPLLLHLAAEGWSELRDPVWWAAAGLGLMVAGYVAWVALNRRR